MSDTAMRLDRSLLGRVAGGALAQPVLAILAIVLLINVGLIAAGSPGKSPVAIVVATVVVIVAGSVGATAYAEADDEAVRWRYYLRHCYRWEDVEQITLVVRPMGWLGLRHLIIVRAGGRNHRITPACACGPGRVEFARQLIRLASSRGIATVNEGWVRS